MVTDDLTLQQAADTLGVHYMTAYRYVRTGMLDAVKSGGMWRVSPRAVARFRAGTEAGPVVRGRRAPWSTRLEARLLAGDSAGAWGVVEAAMVAGVELAEVYLDVLSPAMVRIGERWSRGEIDVANEHRASGVATRLIGRLGQRCLRPGRRRGVVIIGAPAGEAHSLPVLVLGDLLRLRSWEVCDLGVDVPPGSFVHAVREQPDAVAVGLSASSPVGLVAMAETCGTIRAAFPDQLVVIGGRVISGVGHARSFGGDTYAAGAAELDELLAARLAAPRHPA